MYYPQSICCYKIFVITARPTYSHKYTNQVPGDAKDDLSSAYILFYQRSGSRQDSSAQLSLSEKCQQFCADSSGTIKAATAAAAVAAAAEAKAQTAKSLFPADEEDNMSMAEDLSHIIRSLDTPPPSS